MVQLSHFGFSAADGHALRHAERQPVTREEFFRISGELLPNLADIVLDTIVPDLENVYGRWHPTGFMVFPLATHSELGTLRLHIWPEGTRRRQIKGRGYLGFNLYDGDIHNHMWHIKSIILAHYKDRFYATEPHNATAPIALTLDDPAMFRVFRVAYESENPETLTTDGSCVRAEPARNRTLRTGQMHEIEVGQFHAPVLADDEFGATLVISSFRVDADGPDVLIGGAADSIVGNRIEVTAQEARQAKHQLRSLCR